jgi:IS4 transposase
MYKQWLKNKVKHKQFFFVFFYTCMLEINLFLNYLYVILIFFVSILKADESGE